MEIERYTDEASHRTSILPSHPSVGISLVQNLEVAQMIHSLEDEQVFGTWKVEIEREMGSQGGGKRGWQGER